MMLRSKSTECGGRGSYVARLGPGWDATGSRQGLVVLGWCREGALCLAWTETEASDFCYVFEFLLKCEGGVNLEVKKSSVLCVFFKAPHARSSIRYATERELDFDLDLSQAPRSRHDTISFAIAECKKKGERTTKGSEICGRKGIKALKKAIRRFWKVFITQRK